MPTEELTRLLEVTLSRVEWNVPRKIKVESSQEVKLATLKLGEWDRPIAKELARQLFAFADENNDMITGILGKKVLFADLCGPSFNYEFVVMPFEPLFIE